MRQNRIFSAHNARADWHISFRIIRQTKKNLPLSKSTLQYPIVGEMEEPYGTDM